ncbi:MAG: NAD(P)H-dependent oxidoreductase subunit E [Vicinamibacterales bacterium]
MDLHLIPGVAATPAERAAIDAVVDAPSIVDPNDPQGHGHRRHLLLPVLHACQSRIGWVSEGAINHLCERLQLPPADVYGVASFYALLALEPSPPTVVHVCDDIACRGRGGQALCDALERAWGPAGEPALDRRATWQRSPCLGQCDRAPAALVQVTGETPADWSLGGATIAGVQQGVEGGGRAPQAVDPLPPQTRTPRDPSLRLMRRIGLADPTSLDSYRAHGGYTALRRALAMGPDRVIREVTDAGLVGRGGAAFPSGRKWEAVARAAVRPHYLVCNADESEPGTFKDRVLMEEDPFAVIEAMTIAGVTTGCEVGFLYIRGEYPRATARLRSAIEQARTRGLLGDDILGQGGVRFDVELRRGAGAYICGEETAIFNSIEGYRGEPRNKPPFPVQSGVFRKPTVANNVETLVNVLDIVLDGGQAFARIGTKGSTGTKLFCVSGDVAQPGVYEIPFGMTLRALLAMAGGVADARPLRAVLLGGAAGMFVTPDELDMPLTFEGARAAGATLGSGVVLVFDDRADLEGCVLRIAAFFRDESCGQCVPCRVGTVRQEEALRRLQAGRPVGSRAQDVALIDDMAQAMRDASICGLGQTASTAVQTAIRKFNLFQEPIR